jgi:hypothetical protein
VVLAGITGPGRALADQAAALLNEADFGLPDVSRLEAAEVTTRLRALRVSAGDDLADGP